MSNVKVKSSMKLGWIARHFRANPKAAKWNDAAVIVGCLCSLPLAAYAWTGIGAYWEAFKVVSLVWLGCTLTSFWLARNGRGI